jgi:hypothetical protein
MHPLSSLVPIGLVVVGFFSLLLGIGFLAWGAVQKNARAGLGVGPAGILNAIARVVNSLAKYFPNGASKIGAFLVFLGIFLIGGAFYVTTHFPQ